MKKNLLIVLVFALLPLVMTGADQSNMPDYTAGFRALNAWDYDAAAKQVALVRAMLKAGVKPEQETQARSFLSEYYFSVGDYASAAKELEIIKSKNSRTDEDFTKFYDRIKHLAGLTPQASAESEHFVMHYYDPRDKVLAEPGFAALEKAYPVLSKTFGITPGGGKILVDVYPRSADLAAGVGLEEKMIKDSGTVAICKFRRLMITSPRALVYGYDFQNTLSHELVHFFVYKRNGDSVPIWFHEGLARYYDTLYRGEAGQSNPIQKSLLVTAIKNNELITFAQMHPTFAQFKGPKQGQLAFEEVSTIVAYMKDRCGTDSPTKLLDLLKKNSDDKRSLEQVCGRPFNAIWDGWKNWVTAKGWPVIPGAVVVQMEFKEKESKDAGDETPAEPDIDQAGKYVRLGDLLRDRN
jgi:hypothetical protein